MAALTEEEIRQLLFLSDSSGESSDDDVLDSDFMPKNGTVAPSESTDTEVEEPEEPQRPSTSKCKTATHSEFDG